MGQPQNSNLNQFHTLSNLVGLLLAAGTCFGGGYWFRDTQKQSELTDVKSELKDAKDKIASLEKKEPGKKEAGNLFAFKQENIAIKDYKVYYSFPDKNRQAGLELRLDTEDDKLINKLKSSKNIKINIIFASNQKTVQLCLDGNNARKCQDLNKNDGSETDKNTSERSIELALSSFSPVTPELINTITFDAKEIAPYQDAGKSKSFFTVTKVDFIK
jgi:hypothetical protein